MGARILAGALQGAFQGLGSARERRRDNELFEMQKRQFEMTYDAALLQARAARYALKEAKKQGLRDDEMYPLELEYKKRLNETAEIAGSHAAHDFDMALTFDKSAAEAGIQQDLATLENTRQSTAESRSRVRRAGAQDAQQAGDRQRRLDREDADDQAAQYKDVADAYLQLREGVNPAIREGLDAHATSMLLGEGTPDGLQALSSALTGSQPVPTSGGAGNLSPLGVIGAQDDQKIAEGEAKEELEQAIADAQALVDLVDTTEDDGIRQAYKDNGSYGQAQKFLADSFSGGVPSPPEGDTTAAAAGEENAPATGVMGFLGDMLKASPGDVFKGDESENAILEGLQMFKAGREQAPAGQAFDPATGEFVPAAAFTFDVGPEIREAIHTFQLFNNEDDIAALNNLPPGEQRLKYAELALRNPRVGISSAGKSMGDTPILPALALGAAGGKAAQVIGRGLQKVSPRSADIIKNVFGGGGGGRPGLREVPPSETLKGVTGPNVNPFAPRAGTANPFTKSGVSPMQKPPPAPPTGRRITPEKRKPRFRPSMPARPRPAAPTAPTRAQAPTAGLRPGNSAGASQASIEEAVQKAFRIPPQSSQTGFGIPQGGGIGQGAAPPPQVEAIKRILSSPPQVSGGAPSGPFPSFQGGGLPGGGGGIGVPGNPNPQALEELLRKLNPEIQQKIFGLGGLGGF